MTGHKRVHLYLPHGHVIDVHDDDGRMIHNFGELTEQHGGSFVLTITPEDFKKEARPECPYDDCHGSCCVDY